MTTKIDGQYAKLPLERIFNGNTARVLDHLVTMKPFDFSFDELMDILQLEAKQLQPILIKLNKFGLVDETEDNKAKLADNPRTLALHKFMHESVLYNLEQMRTKGDKGN